MEKKSLASRRHLELQGLRALGEQRVAYCLMSKTKITYKMYLTEICRLITFHNKIVITLLIIYFLPPFHTCNMIFLGSNSIYLSWFHMRHTASSIHSSIILFAHTPTVPTNVILLYLHRLSIFSLIKISDRVYKNVQPLTMNSVVFLV